MNTDSIVSKYTIVLIGHSIWKTLNTSVMRSGPAKNSSVQDGDKWMKMARLFQRGKPAERQSLIELVQLRLGQSHELSSRSKPGTIEAYSHIESIREGFWALTGVALSRCVSTLGRIVRDPTIDSKLLLPGTFEFSTRMRDRLLRCTDGRQRLVAALQILTPLYVEAVVQTIDEMSKSAEDAMLLEELSRHLYEHERLIPTLSSRFTKAEKKARYESVEAFLLSAFTMPTAFYRQLIEVFAVLRVQNNMSTDPSVLMDVLKSSPIVNDLARLSGSQIVGVHQILAGCSPDCYAPEGRVIPPSSPHFSLLDDWYDGNVADFVNRHVSDGWLDPNQLALYGPSGALGMRHDLSDAIGPGHRQSIGNVNSPFKENRGCPAVFERTTTRLFEFILSFAQDEIVWTFLCEEMSKKQKSSGAGGNLQRANSLQSGDAPSLRGISPSVFKGKG